MRGALRRRLQEDVADRWSDADLNLALNHGLIELEKEILKVDPEAFSYIDRADIVANQEYYEWPDGIWYERELRYLNSSPALPLTYTSMRRINFNERADGAHTDASVTCYARFDRERFVLAPVPTASIVNGLEIVYVPSLSMAQDTDHPPVHLGLHLAVVLFAEIISLADVGDGSDETIKDLARMINSIPQYYLVSAGTPARLVIEGIFKGY
jgi:hypothetical protein